MYNKIRKIVKDAGDQPHNKSMIFRKPPKLHARSATTFYTMFKPNTSIGTCSKSGIQASRILGPTFGKVSGDFLVSIFRKPTVERRLNHDPIKSDRTVSF